jgi:hypothetical protein
MSSVPWLEMALAACVIALVFELFPGLGNQLIKWSDVTTWSRRTWFLANLIFVLSLLLVRFGPELLQIYRTADSDANRKGKGNHPRS